MAARKTKSPTAWTAPLIGEWEGTTKIWFEPGKLADTAAETATVRAILGGKFLVHEYQGSVSGKPHEGFALIAVHPSGRASIVWGDTFHMSDEPLISEGDATRDGLDVLGTYAAGDGPRWGWRTTLAAKKNQLVVTMFNITPNGDDAKAVETIYRRSSAAVRTTGKDSAAKKASAVGAKRAGAKSASSAASAKRPSSSPKKAAGGKKPSATKRSDR